MSLMTTLDACSETYTQAACEVCGFQSVPWALDLSNQPMCDDLVPVGDDRQCKRYPIKISLCPNCLTAHQTHRIIKETLFPIDYHYRPRFTKDVLEGMAGLVDEIESKYGPVRGKRVVDVGCNDGSLLSIFSKRGALTCGIEPTGAAKEAADFGHQVVHDFFSIESACEIARQFGRADIVTFTNVFAHIESLPDAIAALKSLVHEGSLVVIENHYLGTVLDTFQFDTFYHEHPRTYSMRSFEFIANSLDAEVLSVSFPSRYGGNIRVVIGNFGGSKSFVPADGSEVIARNESGFQDKLERMKVEVDNWKLRTRSSLDELANQGIEIHGKSFPGRAAILVHLLGIDRDDQPYVYEKPGSLKIGHYLPGTRIEIRSDDEWTSGASCPDAMLIWGWHISGEIAAYLRKAGYTGRLFVPLPTFTEIF